MTITTSNCSAMYDLGRQAREAGYETTSCNLTEPVRRSWWLAGWHDKDIEMGVMAHKEFADRQFKADAIGISA